MSTQVYFSMDDDNETSVTDILYPGYPHFETGDIIHLEVKNNNTKVWDVQPMQAKQFTVTRKEHMALKYYGSEVSFQISLFIFLKES